MAWLQLCFHCPRDTAEAASELLEKFAAVSISLEAVSDEPIFSEGLAETGLWEQVRVSVLLPEDTELDILLAVLRNQLGEIAQAEIEHLPDQDWVAHYQDTHGPQLYQDKLCICPGWCTPPENIPYILMLDPGLAFGTGSHETTALCLDWLAAHELKGKQVIDYGCGSGILALAAVLMGAEHAWAVDIDDQALAATAANARRNNLNGRITMARPAAVELPVADIVLANILMNPLKQLASQLAGLVRSGGSIVLSGLLCTQAEECLAVYQSWFNMQAPVYHNEWARLSGVRR